MYKKEGQEREEISVRLSYKAYHGGMSARL